MLKMNDLVTKLTVEQHVVASRPTPTAVSLKESIDRDYVHILFTATDTELGVRLRRNECKLDRADFPNAKGSVRLVGGLILDYSKVKCTADIDLSNCEGTGFLETVTDEEYSILMNK